MAMPPDTPMPWMVKLMAKQSRGPRAGRREKTLPGSRGAGANRGYRDRAKAGGSPPGPRPPAPGPRKSFPFPELVADQLDQRGHGLFLVRAVGLDGDDRALGRRQHHDPHDALGVDAAAFARDPDLGGELGRELRKLRGSPGMQAQLVYDLNFPLLHSSPVKSAFA